MQLPSQGRLDLQESVRLSPSKCVDMLLRGAVCAFPFSLGNSSTFALLGTPLPLKIDNKTEYTASWLCPLDVKKAKNESQSFKSCLHSPKILPGLCVQRYPTHYFLMHAAESSTLGVAYVTASECGQIISVRVNDRFCFGCYASKMSRFQLTHSFHYIRFPIFSNMRICIKTISFV